MIQSYHFDGVVPNWYHFECFWKKGGFNASDASEFEGLADIRWEDQERISAKLAEREGKAVASSAKGGAKGKKKPSASAGKAAEVSVKKGKLSVLMLVCTTI